MIISHLPLEINSDILSRLPFEYAVPCREVCKTWLNLLRHIKRDKKINLLFMGRSAGMHQLYHGEYDEKDNSTLREQLSRKALTPLGCSGIVYTNHLMACSHRGLVCVYRNPEGFNNAKYPIHICNPSTQETVRLPKLTLLKDAENDFVVIGFGYLYATNEYKIVRIFHEYGTHGQVHVYTLGDNNNGWRDKGRTNHRLSRSEGVLYNGALYWIAENRLEFVVFDLADEKFWSVPIPPCFPEEKITNRYGQLLLSMLGGYLSIVLQFGNSIDIWLLKDKKSVYSVEGHWSKEVTIHPEDDDYYYSITYHPFALTEENIVMVWHKKPMVMGSQNTLFQYDPKTATLENIWDDAETNFQAIPYMKCDVSLTALVPDWLPIVKWYDPVKRF